MADLQYSDKVFLEKAFQMSSGYVLDFSDRTFEDFVCSVLGFNVHEKYTGSKANKMRKIWKNESNISVAKLLYEIANSFFEEITIEDIDEGLPYIKKQKTVKGSDYNKIQAIANRLMVAKPTIQSHKSIQDYENLNDFIRQAWEDLSNERCWEAMTKAKTDDYPSYVKQLITGTAAIVNNIAEARNDCSSAHAPKYKPKKHHAQFCLEQAISLMNFIISVEESFKN